MATTNNLLITLLESNQNNPHVTVNEGTETLDQALAGLLKHNMATDADYTLSTTSTPPEWLYLYIQITDVGTVLTTTRNIFVPDQNKLYVFDNATLQSLVLKTSAGTGVTVATLQKQILYCDGTNVFALAAAI